MKPNQPAKVFRYDLMIAILATATAAIGYLFANPGPTHVAAGDTAGKIVAATAEPIADALVVAMAIPLFWAAILLGFIALFSLSSFASRSKQLGRGGNAITIIGLVLTAGAMFVSAYGLGHLFNH
jgi:hypothetical protein